MISSISPDRVSRTLDVMHQQNQLLTSPVLATWLEKAALPEVMSEDRAPLEYHPVPPSAPEDLQRRIVVPIAHITNNGFLHGNSAYSIRSETAYNSEFQPHIQQALVAAHGLAERAALLRGIFSPGARKTGEVLVARSIPLWFRNGYIEERRLHLNEVATKAKSNDAGISAERRTLLLNELELGSAALSELVWNPQRKSKR